MAGRHPTFLIIPCLPAAMLMTACGGNGTSNSPATPRDTVSVQEGVSGVVSIAYFENAIQKSTISIEDLLEPAEVHSVEEQPCKYDDLEQAKEHPEFADGYLATPHNSAAMRQANRFMRMACLVNMDGNAKDKRQWAAAVKVALDTFLKDVPSVPPNSAIDEIERVTDKFSPHTQVGTNFAVELSASSSSTTTSVRTSPSTDCCQICGMGSRLDEKKCQMLACVNTISYLCSTETRDATTYAAYESNNPSGHRALLDYSGTRERSGKSACLLHSHKPMYNLSNFGEYYISTRSRII